MFHPSFSFFPPDSLCQFLSIITNHIRLCYFPQFAPSLHAAVASFPVLFLNGQSVEGGEEIENTRERKMEREREREREKAFMAK